MEKLVITKVEDLDNFEEEFIELGRRGVIELAVPVLNINEWHAAKPSYYSLLLGMTDQELDKIAYYAAVVVAESQLEVFAVGEVLSGDRLADYEKLSDEDKEKVKVLQGAEAVEFLIKRIDLMAKFKEARNTEISCMQKLEDLWEKYDEIGGADIMFDLEKRIVEAGPDENGDITIDMTEEEAAAEKLSGEIDDTNTKLEEVRCVITAIARIKEAGTGSLIVKEINLFPVDLRGIMKHVLAEMPYAIDDIKHQYMRTVSRNERVKKLVEMQAPDIILRNEKRILQEYVDCLVNNGRRGRPYTAKRNDERCPVISLTDILLKNSRLL